MTPIRFQKRNKPNPSTQEEVEQEASPGGYRERLARDAFDWPRATLASMAEDIGLSRSSLAAYRAGQRRLPDAVALRLAGWLRRRAELAERLATELEGL